MSKIVPAAVQLMQQVTSINPTMKASATDKPDGFGRHRSIEFDAKTSKWLAPALDVIGDERIDHIDYEGKGRATVTFVSTTKADSPQAYPLSSVLTVLRGED